MAPPQAAAAMIVVIAVSHARMRTSWDMRDYQQKREQEGWRLGGHGGRSERMSTKFKC